MRRKRGVDWKNLTSIIGFIGALGGGYYKLQEDNKQMVQESQQSSQQQIDSSVMSSSGPGERENDVSNIDISPDLQSYTLWIRFRLVDLPDPLWPTK